LDKKPALRLPEIDGECSAELRKRHAALTKEAATIGKDWQKLVGDSKRFTDQDPADFDPTEGRRIAEGELKILQRDLAIREEVLAVDAAIRAECADFARAASKRLAEAKAEVERGLRNIGFTEPPPLSISHHPEVIGAENRLTELRQRANEKDLLVSTRDAQKQLGKALSAIKSRLSKI
jgi:hypothetical protein